MSLEEIREALKPYNLKAVADLMGINHATLWRLASGKTQRPSWQLVNKVEAFLNGERVA